MSALCTSLESVVESLDEDHWRLAFALQRMSGPAPRDRGLAALYYTVWSSDDARSLLELADEHPTAAFLHLQWAAESRPQPPAPAVRPGRPAMPVALPLAS
jgi:hypothetical protein